MGKSLEITEKLQKYIDNFSLKLNPIQQEIIEYNNTLGEIKRMQLSISQVIRYLLYFLPWPWDSNI